MHLRSEIGPGMQLRGGSRHLRRGKRAGPQPGKPSLDARRSGRRRHPYPTRLSGGSRGGGRRGAPSHRGRACPHGLWGGTRGARHDLVLRLHRRHSRTRRRQHDVGLPAARGDVGVASPGTRHRTDGRRHAAPVLRRHVWGWLL